nr:uncharacterized protein LOC110131922 [Odocoileus virginianus texanus]
MTLDTVVSSLHHTTHPLDCKVLFMDTCGDKAGPVPGTGEAASIRRPPRPPIRVLKQVRAGSGARGGGRPLRGEACCSREAEPRWAGFGGGENDSGHPKPPASAGRIGASAPLPGPECNPFINKTYKYRKKTRRIRNPPRGLYPQSEYRESLGSWAGRIRIWQRMRDEGRKAARTEAPEGTQGREVPPSAPVPDRHASNTPRAQRTPRRRRRHPEVEVTVSHDGVQPTREKLGKDSWRY